MNTNQFFFHLLGVSICLVAKTAARLHGEGIVGGYEASENQFPYQVAVLANGNQICGGGILDDEHILTAAHCVIDEVFRNFTGSFLTVVGGIEDLNDAYTIGTVVPVERIYAHNRFDPHSSDWSNDIAVLKLKWSLNVDGNKKLKKLQLPTDINETYSKKEATIAGYGFDKMKIVPNHMLKRLVEQGDYSDSKLKYVITDIVDEVECRMKYGLSRDIFDSHICASAKQHKIQPFSGVCSGDSGGPLVYKNETVIGIVSTSPFGCTEAYIPAVYTRVSSFLDFIDDARNNNVNSDMRIYDY